MKTSAPIDDAIQQVRRTSGFAVEGREALPETEQRPHRIIVAAAGDIGNKLLACLAASDHTNWYALAIAQSEEDVIRLLTGEPAEVNILDEWSNEIVKKFLPGQRHRIQRQAILITDLEAPGIEAVTCFASLPRIRLTRHSLDHVLWQAIRQADVQAIKPTASAVFDVLKSLARLGLPASADLASAMRPITEAGAHAIGADRVSIWRFEDGPKQLVCLDMFDRTPGTHVGGMTNPVSNIPVYCMALENHRILPMEDALHDYRCAELLPYLRQSGIGALLDAPIYLDGKVIGLLCHAHFGGPRQWTEDEKTIAANLADYVQILCLANQRHQAEEALRVNQQVLAHAQKMEALGRLSCGIAHDFNNLLQVISGNAQIFESKVQSNVTSGLHHVGDIIEACDRASSLARKLLNLGRQTTDTPRWVDLNSLARDVARLVGTGLSASITLHFVPGAQAAWAFLESDELQNTLINLVANARDAMPKGGQLHLVVEASYPLALPEGLDRAGGPYTCITVRDSGTGMPIEVRTRAMEPFFTTKGVDKGTGLGLWNVYNFMRRCRGHVAIDSEPDQGTAIRLYVPTVSEPPTSIRDEAPAKHLPTGAGHVLLVDDDEAVQRIVADMLGFLGHQVTVCGEGALAVECFRTGRSSIDLVLVDLNMPGMSGHECLRALRTIDPSCRCLIMSGSLSDEIANDCLREGAVGILAKPFSLTACAKAVEKALATSREGRDHVACD